MKAVIFYNYIGALSGAVINAFEYFLALYERDKSVKLILLNCDSDTRDRFINIVENRCNLQDLDYKNNIELIGKIDLVDIKFNVALILDYGTIYKIRGFVNTDRLVVVQDKKTHLREYQFDEDVYNCIFFGEMPFQKKHKQYRMKFLFDRYKKIDKCSEGIYVNSPRNKDDSFIRKIQLPNKPLIRKSTLAHLPNLFSHFDTYVYYHANKWFDPSPRLFVECCFYGKEIYYFNEPNVIDGSYYRYNDIMQNGIENRNFSDNDEVIREFLDA